MTAIMLLNTTGKPYAGDLNFRVGCISKKKCANMEKVSIMAKSSKGSPSIVK